MNLKTINSFDIDGVIILGPDWIGVRPGPDDVIITGRSVEESRATLEMLTDNGIYNQVFFNPKSFALKTRETSGQHKVCTIQMLQTSGYYINVHFEDDEIQVAIMRRAREEKRIYTEIVHLVHSLTEKENSWHSVK